MKKLVFTALIIFLAITSGVSFVSAENETEEILESKEEYKNESERVGEIVTTPTGGSKNISFDDGYNGYCINKGWGAADEGDLFTVKNTSMATNSINHEYIGNYLKILFVDYYDFAINDADETAKIIWNFSDRNYMSSTNPIIQDIIAIDKSGRVIPDHGEIKRIDEDTEAIFDFEVLDSHNRWDQNFFGYKITYRQIKKITNSTQNDTLNNTNETNSTTVTNETLKNNTYSNITQNYKTNPVKDITDKNINENITDTQIKKSNDNHIITKSTGNPIFSLLLLLITIFTINGRRD